jgi:hypothetical protein
MQKRKKANKKKKKNVFSQSSQSPQFLFLNSSLMRLHESWFGSALSLRWKSQFTGFCTTACVNSDSRRQDDGLEMMIDPTFLMHRYRC